MEQTSPRLLLVEDDAALAEMLRDLLAEEDYAVEVARDGQRGLHLGLTRDYDVVVLDRGLPAVEGLDLLSRWRSQGMATPVLVLSAQGLPQDRVDGLNAGAEDYVAKPFDVEELLARLRVLLRGKGGAVRGRVAVPGGWLDPDQRTVLREGGEPVALSGREAALLTALARRPHQVLTRADLMALAFPEAEDPGVVDTYVHYVRRKLGRTTVRTVHGLGYRLGRT